MKKSRLLLLLFVLYFYLIGKAAAQFTVGSVTVTPSVLTTNLQVPWELVWGPDNFIWMTERYGRISRVNPVSGQVLPLITITDVQQTGESGLLGMVLHPNFTTNPYVYVAYTYNKNNQVTEKVVRYTYTGSALNSPLILLDNISGFTNHDGSRLLILPDLTLLITTGDANNTSTAQNLNSLNGKILRLNLDGTVPANNPIPGSYMYSFGHRNPQGLLRAPNGKIFSSEHGPNNDDEFNEILPNRNYGWPTVQGFCNTSAEQTFCNANNVKIPLAAWTPTLAVAGIAFYDHPAIPGWQNSVLMTTLKATKLVQLKLNAAGDAVASQTVFLNGTYGRLRSICVSPDGVVYIGTSNRDGRIQPIATDDRIIVLKNLAFSPTGINETEALNSSFKILNYGIEGKMKLQFSESLKQQTVTIFATNGTQIMQKPVPGNLQLVIDTKSFKAGIYLVRVNAVSQKFMVSR